MDAQSGPSGRDEEHHGGRVPKPEIQAAKITSRSTILAAVIGAGVTFVGMVVTAGGSKEEGAVTSTPTASRPAVAALPESPISNPSTAAAGASPAGSVVPPVRYKGKISITSRGDKDLDGDPPANVEDDSGGDFFYNLINGQVYSTDDAAWAKWESKKLPAYSDCKGYADAAALNTMKLRIGEMVCVRTTDGRVARMKLIDYPDCYCAVFDAVVWELT